MSNTFDEALERLRGTGTEVAGGGGAQSRADGR
jgi:hypothetical protein